MRKIWAIAILLGLTTPALAVEYRSPNDVAREFCKFIDSSRRDIFAPHFKPLATTSLLKAIRKAEDKNSIIAKTYPNEKPPLGDGIPYQSYQDHAPFCRVDDVSYQRRKGEAIIAYIFPDTPEANWTDRLKLKNINGVWQIDDILYGSDKAHMTLRQVLKQAFPQE